MQQYCVPSSPEFASALAAQGAVPPVAVPGAVPLSSAPLPGTMFHGHVLQVASQQPPAETYAPAASVAGGVGSRPDPFGIAAHRQDPADHRGVVGDCEDARFKI